MTASAWKGDGGGRGGAEEKVGDKEVGEVGDVEHGEVGYGKWDRTGEAGSRERGTWASRNRQEVGSTTR